MLKKIDYTGKKGGSIYLCDRCNKRINTEDEKRYKIMIDTFVNMNMSKVKKLGRYDLCKKCAGSIIKYIRKGNTQCNS